MKIIEISDEQYQFLQSLAQRMGTQDNRCTQDVAFSIYEKSRNGTLKINDKAGIFLTEQACEDHLESNHYHYRVGVSYGISLWRNPEMVGLINCIFSITGVEMPSHYSKAFRS